MEDHFAGSVVAHGGPNQSSVLVAPGGLVMLCVTIGTTKAAMAVKFSLILSVLCIPALNA